MAEDTWAEKIGDTYQEWALSELKQVGQRNFEMSKHLFAASASSFAIFPFLGESVSYTNYFQLIGLFLLAGSALIAIVMAEPPHFKIDGDENLVKLHTEYAAHGKSLRHFWALVWISGIALILLTTNRDIPEPGSEITVRSNKTGPHG